MKRKKFLGFLGLFLVAATTTFAALMPSSLTSAAPGGQSVTDEITVRVVGNVPKVYFVEPSDGSRLTDPNLNLSVDYENVDTFSVEIEYTDVNGNWNKYVLAEKLDADYNPGRETYKLNLDEDPWFGYGEYLVRVKGNGYGAENVDEDVIRFSYNSFRPGFPGGDNGPGSSEDNPLTGDPVIDFNINPNDPYIDRLEVNVYDEDGNLVEEVSPQEVYSPFDDLTLPFQEHGLPSGWYTVEIQAYDKDGNPDGEKVSLRFYYQAPEAPIDLDVPNTGGAIMDLSISQKDYLLTGVVIFGIAAVIGVALVLRKKAAKRKK